MQLSLIFKSVLRNQNPFIPRLLIPHLQVRTFTVLCELWSFLIWQVGMMPYSWPWFELCLLQFFQMAPPLCWSRAQEGPQNSSSTELSSCLTSPQWFNLAGVFTLLPLLKCLPSLPMSSCSYTKACKLEAEMWVTMELTSLNLLSYCSHELLSAVLTHNKNNFSYDLSRI